MKDVEELKESCKGLRDRLYKMPLKHKFFAKIDIKEIFLLILADCAFLVWGISELIKMIGTEGSFDYKHTFTDKFTIIVVIFTFIVIALFLVYSIVSTIIQLSEHKNDDIKRLYKDNRYRLFNIKEPIMQLELENDRIFDNFDNGYLIDSCRTKQKELEDAISEVEDILSYLNSLLTSIKDIVDTERVIAMLDRGKLLALLNRIIYKLNNETADLNIRVTCKNIKNETKEFILSYEMTLELLRRTRV